MFGVLLDVGGEDEGVQVSKVLTRACLIAAIALLGFAVVTLWFRNKGLENDNAEIRTQLLDRVTEDVGGRTATYAKPKKVERAAIGAVGESVVAAITSVADVESVATASETVASTSAGYYQVTDDSIVLKDNHSRFTVSVPSKGTSGESGEVSFLIRQEFEYSLVRFKNNGEAILLNVKERSPLTHEILRETMVTPDEFLVARHRKKLRERFGWSATCGLGYTGAGEMDVTCGVGYGFRF